MKPWVSKTLALLGTVAQVGTTSHATTLEEPLNHLTSEVQALTRQVELQNNFWHRLWLALVVGAGTALGASVIATIVIFLLKPLLTLVGLGDLIALHS